MSEIDMLRDLEAEGYFERARAGDHRACGLFARLAAFRLNPAGDPAGWGCLRKTGGGANVDGYAEDAIVLGSDPGNLHNVVDIIGGAGRPGASVAWGGFVERRPADMWEQPRPLDDEQASYLRGGEPERSSGGVRSGGDTETRVVVAPPVDLSPVLEAIARLQGQVDGLRARLDQVLAASAPPPAPTADALNALTGKFDGFKAEFDNLQDRLIVHGLQIRGRAGGAVELDGSARLPPRPRDE